MVGDLQRVAFFELEDVGPRFGKVHVTGFAPDLNPVKVFLGSHRVNISIVTRACKDRLWKNYQDLGAGT